MPITVAATVVSWLAIIMLYFGLVAVMREVRLLRAQIGRESGYVAGAPGIAFDPTLVQGQARLVLAVDSACPMCQIAADQLAEHAEELPVRPILLTYESPDVWDRVASRLTVVTDSDAWRAVAHLTPPVLANVDAAGAVTRLALLTNEHDVSATLTEWHLMKTRVR
jgi:hypothetical protein